MEGGKCSGYGGGALKKLFLIILAEALLQAVSLAEALNQRLVTRQVVIPHFIESRCFKQDGLEFKILVFKH